MAFLRVSSLDVSGSRWPRWLGGRLRRLGCFCRVGGGRVGVEFRLGGFQAGQRLKSAARLAAQFGLEGGEVAARAQLAAVFVHHAHIHEQVRGQHVEFEVGAFDVQPGFAAHDLQQRVGQAAVAEGVGRAQFFSQPRGAFGQGHEAAAGLLRQAFEQGLDFFFQHAGHEHSQRASLIWLSTNSGAVTVRPSRASPGWCR